MKKNALERLSTLVASLGEDGAVSAQDSGRDQVKTDQLKLAGEYEGAVTKFKQYVEANPDHSAAAINRLNQLLSSFAADVAYQLSIITAADAHHAVATTKAIIETCTNALSVATEFIDHISGGNTPSSFQTDAEREANQMETDFNNAFKDLGLD